MHSHIYSLETAVYNMQELEKQCSSLSQKLKTVLDRNVIYTSDDKTIRNGIPLVSKQLSDYSATLKGINEYHYYFTDWRRHHHTILHAHDGDGKLGQVAVEIIQKKRAAAALEIQYAESELQRLSRLLDAEIGNYNESFKFITLFVGHLEWEENRINSKVIAENEIENKRIREEKAAQLKKAHEEELKRLGDEKAAASKAEHEYEFKQIAQTELPKLLKNRLMTVGITESYQNAILEYSQNKITFTHKLLDDFIHLLDPKNRNPLLSQLLQIPSKSQNLKEAMKWLVEIVFELRNKDSKSTIEDYLGKMSQGLREEILSQIHYQDFTNQIPLQIKKLNDEFTELFKGREKLIKDSSDGKLGKIPAVYTALGNTDETKYLVKLDKITEYLNEQKMSADKLAIPSQYIHFDRVFKSVPYSQMNVAEAAVLYTLAFEIAMLKVKWLTRKIEKDEITATADFKVSFGSSTEDKSGKLTAYKLLELDVQAALDDYNGKNFASVYLKMCDLVKNVYEKDGPFKGLNRGWKDYAAGLFKTLKEKLYTKNRINPNYYKDIMALTMQNSIDEKAIKVVEPTPSITAVSMFAPTAANAVSTAATAAADNTLKTPAAGHHRGPSRMRDRDHK